MAGQQVSKLEVFIASFWRLTDHDHQAEYAIGRRAGSRQRENSFRDKFERYFARDRDNPDLRRKAPTAITAKMARVVHAVIKSGSDYRPFFEGMVPGGRPPSVEP